MEKRYLEKQISCLNFKCDEGLTENLDPVDMELMPEKYKYVYQFYSTLEKCLLVR